MSITLWLIRSEKCQLFSPDLGVAEGLLVLTGRFGS